jgi:hypothetical protein
MSQHVVFHNQSVDFRCHNRHRVRSGQAPAGAWRIDCVAAVDFRDGYDLALARETGCGQHGRALNRNILVCAAIAADVPADPDVAQSRVCLLGLVTGWLHPDNCALPTDDRNNIQNGSKSVNIPTLNPPTLPHV